MIDKIPFGRTGHTSTRTLFGAAALAQVTQAEADRTINLVVEYGLNHFDTAASYGESEYRLGPWLKHNRDQVFLATKTENRTYESAKEELHRSLEKMQTDHVDLWQMHLLVDPQDWETAMGPGGALEAFIEAREQGLTRFLGVTGHGVTIARMHLRSLERFDFDSVLLPYNYTMMQNQQYAADFAELLAVCRENQVAVQTIKSLTRAPWGDKSQTHATWYEPFTKQSDIDTAVHWALNKPGIFINTVADIHLLPKVLDAADRFTPRSQAELDADISQLTMEPLFV